MCISVGALISFSSQKEEFDRFFNRLDRPVEESWPDRCRSTRPVSISDARLEPKAKNTKKIQGQEQFFRGQILSRPRIGMLEAKAKDQGRRRKCSPKKDIQKFFSGDLKKKVFKKIFQAIY